MAMFDVNMWLWSSILIMIIHTKNGFTIVYTYTYHSGIIDYHPRILNIVTRTLLPSFRGILRESQLENEKFPIASGVIKRGNGNETLW